jgi:hypothetical protein
VGRRRRRRKDDHPPPRRVPPGTPPFTLFKKNQAFLAGASRRIAWFNAARATHVIAIPGLIALFVSLFVATQSIPLAADEFAFTWYSVPASARVVRLWEQAGGRGGKVYYVVYRVEGDGAAGLPADGERTARVPAEAYQGLEVDGPLAVHYRPDRVDDVRADAARTVNPVMECLLVVVLLAAGGAGLARLIYLWRRARRLAREGRRLDAEVVDCAGDPRARGGYFVRLRYRFTPPEEAPVEASDIARRDDLQGKLLPQAGAPLAVLYVSKHLYQVL